MADKPFRVLLDLTDLNNENFKYVWINVSPRELKTISDLKKSILHKVHLEKEGIKLFVRDGLLLDEETIIVLREDDTVKVQFDGPFPTSVNHMENSSKERASRKRKHNKSNISNALYKPEKSETQDDILDCNSNEINLEEMNRERKKCKSHSLSVENETDISKTLEESNHNIIKSYKKKKNKDKSSAVDFNFSKNQDSFFSFDAENSLWDQGRDNVSPSHTASSKQNTLNAITKNSSSENNFSCQESGMGLNESLKITTECKMSDGVNNNCPKKKRRRRRKRRKVSELAIVDVPDNNDASSKFRSFSESFNENTNRKHIVYVNPEELQNQCSDNGIEVQNMPAETFILKEDKFNDSGPSAKDYPKVSTPAQSDGCSNPSWQVSLTRGRNSMYSDDHSSTKSGFVSSDKPFVNKQAALQKFKKNEIIPQEQCTELSTSPSSLKVDACKNVLFSDETQSVICGSANPIKNTTADKKGKMIPQKQYVDLPALNLLPRVGTLIAYKTLELDESYSPVITDYREGIVKNINPDTQEVEIELSKELIIPGRTGKFENLKEDEIPPPEIKTCDVVKWSSIISPKYLS